MITYGDAKKILAQYAGRGGQFPDAPSIDLFCKKVFQYLLITGSYGNLRKFCFQSNKGCITIPYELESPLKVRIDNQVGTVWNKWFEYYHYGELEGCVPVSNALYEEPNQFCTVYDLPNKFCRVGCIGTACEAEDAHIIVSGKDPSGREIFTNHEGNQISGEYIRIRQGELRYTETVFGEITSIYKTKTVGYVQLMWVRPEISNLRGFLADYSPFEERPSYRRFKLTAKNCGHSVNVSVIGRIRIKDHYGDNEKIPFDNLYTLEIAGQQINKNFTDDMQMAQAKDQFLQDVITRESEYKRVQPGSPVDVFFPTSAGNIKGIVG